MAGHRIENIVASTNLNTPLNLDKVSELLENTEYNPDNFPGVIWRPSTSYGVALIFDDGKLMCTNVRSVEEVDNLFKRLIKRLEELNIMTPRTTCPKCGAVVDSEDVVCIECGFLLQETT